ncbi:MAG: dCMP deaminase family protein [archaeon]
MPERKRIGVDEYFMKIARVVSERSTCLPHRSLVGAVMVRDKRILATGYNGPPHGYPHCKTCLRDDSVKGENMELCPAVHAEQNAIIHAALHGVSTHDSTLYCTHFPCVSCLRMLINAGVKRVVYGKEYDMENPVKRDLIKKCKLQVSKF